MREATGSSPPRIGSRGQGFKDQRKSLPRSKPNSPPSDSRDASTHDRPKIGITVHPRRGLGYFGPYRRAGVAAGAGPLDPVRGPKTRPDPDGPVLPRGWALDPTSYGEPRAHDLC